MTVKGTLATFLGTAPGVGKTYAMLSAGRQHAEHGERVVVGWIERHGRAETREQLGDLAVIEAREIWYRGRTFLDLDVDAVIESSADVVLVDELAHTSPDGARKRWEDVADIRAAGLHVMTTANVANLHSVRDYAARVTGSGVVESVPDEVVRSGEVVLVDVPPDVLRQRIVSGRVYSADRVGGALAQYFRIANLEALSELARAWVADQVEDVGDELLVRRGLADPQSRPLVVAGVSDSDWGELVLRRAADISAEHDADLLVVHVNVVDGVAHRPGPLLDRYRQETAELGGTYIEVDGADPAEGLARIAEARRASRVVVARHRSRVAELTRGSVASRLRRLLHETDVDIVGRDRPATGDER